MTAPRYLKINGTWYVSKQHMAEQMERAIADAISLRFTWPEVDVPVEITVRDLTTEEIVTQ